jgi:hypothetical protein
MKLCCNARGSCRVRSQDASVVRGTASFIGLRRGSFAAARRLCRQSRRRKRLLFTGDQGVSADTSRTITNVLEAYRHSMTKHSTYASAASTARMPPRRLARAAALIILCSFTRRPNEQVKRWRTATAGRHPFRRMVSSILSDIDRRFRRSSVRMPGTDRAAMTCFRNNLMWIQC